MFSLPSGVIRALGGWMSDKFGGRQIMYWVLGASTIISLMLMVPKMEIQSPGRGVMAKRAGVVQAVTAEAVVVKEVKASSEVLGEQPYPLKAKPDVMEKL